MRFGPAAILAIAICVSLTVSLTGTVHGSPRVVAFDNETLEAKPAFEILSSSEDRVTVRFDLPAVEVGEIEIEGRTFSSVAFFGSQLHGELGRPAIPAITRMVSIPDRAGVSLRVIDTVTERLEGLDLIPMQPDSESEEFEGS